jgi:DNA-binding HxlR family transcriptional regulator
VTLLGAESRIQQIFQAKGQFRGSTAHWHQLIDCYAGNPLALKIVATTIQNVFAGSIPDFLNQNTTVFGDCLNLLDQHFNRLSDTEQEMIQWLATNRKPASFSQLQNQISPPMSPQTLLEALESLEARCLITKVTGIDKQSFYFSLQPVVVEYVADRLLKEIITQVKFQALPSEHYPNFVG